jgi:hypothetical protein
MKIAVCGIACEACPRMVRGTCETTKKGPIAFGYCQYISGKN